MGDRPDRMDADGSDTLEARLGSLEAGLAALRQEQAALAQRGPSTREHEPNYVDRGTQQLLAMQYRRDAAAGIVHDFDAVEFRNHSQTGEDGILHYLFSVVGTVNKYAVEMCAGDGRECNTANLVINHGWHALLCDGDEANVRTANEFYRRHPDTARIPPAICHAWLTMENVNDVVRRHGFDREIDLLSIDVDGNDYWLWKALDAASPRAVIIEVQPGWRCDASLTVPYDPNFRAARLVDEALGIEAAYCGASLPAMIRLGREKGYRFIGANRYGFNAVFLRNDVAPGLLPEAPPERCFRHPVANWHYGRLPPLLRRERWVEV